LVVKVHMGLELNTGNDNQDGGGGGGGGAAGGGASAERNEALLQDAMRITLNQSVDNMTDADFAEAKADLSKKAKKRKKKGPGGLMGASEFGASSPSDVGGGDDDEDGTRRSSVRQSIRASVRQSMASNTKNAATVATSMQAQHLQLVNRLMSVGWIGMEEANELQNQILTNPEGAPFPDTSQYDWDIENIDNVDVPEDGEADVEFDAAALWGVAQLRCPACFALNSTVRGSACTNCGAALWNAIPPAGQRGPSGPPPASVLEANARAEAEAEAAGLELENDPEAGFTRLAPALKAQAGVAECRYLDGKLVVGVYGCMQQYDHESLSEFTEYVLSCTWRPEADVLSSDGVIIKEEWLVAARFSEFKDMHKKLRKRLQGLVAGNNQFPKFPSKKFFTNRKARVEYRLVGVQGYLVELFALLRKQQSLTHHIEEVDVFLALTERIMVCKKEALKASEQAAAAKAAAQEAEAAAGGAGGGPGGGGAGSCADPAVDAFPMEQSELEQSSMVIAQLWRLIRNGQHDPRDDHDIQHLLRVCLGLLPRLQSSASLTAFTDVECIGLAETCLYDLQVRRASCACVLAVCSLVGWRFAGWFDAGRSKPRPCTGE
jgi:hypothetical protein